jgi:acyl carrier protein
MARDLIAEQLHMNPKRVTDEAWLVADLGTDRLERIELMLAIEDQLAGPEIGEDQADQLAIVGDLVRSMEVRAPSLETVRDKVDRRFARGRAQSGGLVERLWVMPNTIWIS